MKRLFAILFCLVCAFGARAGNNNTATSKNYVDTQVATLQDKIPAIDSNTVLTHTGKSGEIGAKQIYDSNNDFVTQTDALVTAETFNNAVQNAIETEFVCIDWLGEHVPDNCLLWKIQNKTPQQIVPDGYTEIEYIKSDGGAWFDTNVPWMSVTHFHGKAQLTQRQDGYNRAVIGSSEPTSHSGMFGSYYRGADSKHFWYFNEQITPTTRAIFDVVRRNDNGILWYGTVNNNNTDGAYSMPFTGNVLVMTSLDSKWPTNYVKRSFNGSVWYIQLFGTGDTLLFNGIPARRNSDGELGMYDTISGTFFTNSGTGEFIAGPDVSSNIYLPSGN